MPFPFNLYSLALALAFAASAGSIPLWRGFARRRGFIDDPGHRKIHQTSVPLVGGFALATGIAVPLLAGALFLYVATRVALVPTGSSLRLLPGWDALIHGLTRRAVELAAIIGGSVLMLLAGLWDDRRELRPGHKFLLQLVAALLVPLSGLRITIFVPYPIFHYFLTVLWILTVTNAFNFVDNMNGLCAGLALVAAWCFGWAAAVHGQYLVVLLSAVVCGGLLGFLPYNFPKASVFLGDAGSHLVGYLLSVLAILPSFYTAASGEAWAVLNPLLILGVPLLDLVQVVVHRWRIGRPFYLGDTNHLSHRLTRAGLDHTTAVLCLWLAAALLGAFSFLWMF